MKANDKHRKAALKMYVKGATLIQVARHFHVSNQAVSRWVHEAGIMRSAGKPPSANPRPKRPESDLGYKGGWVLARGILRPVPREPEPVQAETPKPKPVAIAQPAADVNAIACPTCHATLAQHCRSKSGRKLKAGKHPNRLIPRTCQCGAELEPRRQLCAPCRSESDRRRSRENKRRTRAAA